MQTRRVKGRKYADPDLITLIDSGEHALDPYAVVEQEATKLLRRFEAFDGGFPTALERITALASLAGYQVKPVAGLNTNKQDRDGVVVGTRSASRRGVILYDPSQIETRSVHTIAHEITHSFFPNSSAGAHFRSSHRLGGPVPELESLCDYGASLLTMPPAAIQCALRGTGISLSAVDVVKGQFGTSYEATLYRVATAATLPVAAGRFRYRSTKAEEFKARQGSLFPAPAGSSPAGLKYRRQSFHRSASYPEHLIFPWNKSLPVESIAYEAIRAGQIVSAEEVLQPKAALRARFRVEAVIAPYQPDDAHDEWPDVLVLLTLLR